MMTPPVKLMPFETNTHSFIVRIWSDESLSSGERVFQGHIMDAYTKRRAPIHELADILAFMAPHVAMMGVNLGWRSRLIMAVNGMGRRLHPALTNQFEPLDLDAPTREEE